MTASPHEGTESFEGQTAMGRPLSINTAYKRWELTTERVSTIDTVAPLRPLRSLYFWGCALFTLVSIAMLAQGEFLAGTLALIGFGLIGLPLTYFSSLIGPELRLDREGLALQRPGRRKRAPYWALPWDGFDGVRVDAARQPISLELNERGQQALRGTRAKVDAAVLRLPRLAIPQLYEAGPWLAEARGRFAGNQARFDDSAAPAEAFPAPAPDAAPEPSDQPSTGQCAEWNAQLLQHGRVTVRTSRSGAAAGTVFFLVLAAICGAVLLIAPHAPAPWNNPLNQVIMAAAALLLAAYALWAAARIVRPTRVVLSREGVRIDRLAVAWHEVQEVVMDTRGRILLVPVPAQATAVMKRLPPLQRVGRSINQRFGDRDGIRLPGLLTETEELLTWLSELHRGARSER